MHTPIGPSLALALGAADALGTAAATVLKMAWDRYLDSGRFDRRFRRLVEKGLVELAAVSGTERIFRLTEIGREAAAGGRDPDARWARPWDGLWRLAVFDVPEIHASRRKRLRRILAAADFGHLQDSAWLSPDTADELRARLRGVASEVETLTFLESRPCSGESDADLVQGAWNFARINRRYEHYLEVLRNRPRWYEAKAWPAWLRVEWNAWRHAVRADPLLPAPLLPSDYRGRAAWAERCAFLKSVVNR